MPTLFYGLLKKERVYKMDFVDEIKMFAKRIEELRPSIETEEATKTSIILPFFQQLLGYDVFNPEEFTPEFSADIGLKRAEKVDYAIKANGKPIIIIECKCLGECLKSHHAQLFKYFAATAAKFAILTNGEDYQFYSDLDSPNQMDKTPFLEINLSKMKDEQISELKKFHKSNFDTKKILERASDLKYTNEFKNIFSEQLKNPSDDFVRFFLSIAYNKRQTQNAIEYFRLLLKKALHNYINELMNEKIKTALESDSVESLKDIELELEEKNTKIHTTQEELESYVIVKTLLSSVVDVQNITYKDTGNYFAILYGTKNTNWICRLYLNSKTSKYIVLNTPGDEKLKVSIRNIYDIKNIKEQLKEIVRRFL